MNGSWPPSTAIDLFDSEYGLQTVPVPITGKQAPFIAGIVVAILTHKAEGGN